MLAAVSFTAHRIVRILFILAGTLFFFGLAATYLIWELKYETAMGFIPLFNLDGEYNIPALFSVGLITVNAMLLFLIGKHNRTKEGHKRYWSVLSYIFLFLAFDEFTSMHERIGGIVYRFAPSAFPVSESRYWMLPFSILIIAFLSYFYRFIFQLQKISLLRFCIAGGIYIGGAMGVEWLGDQYIWMYGSPDFTYGMLSCLEEMLEMVGMIYFFRALLFLLSEDISSSRLTIQFIIGNTKNNNLSKKTPVIHNCVSFNYDTPNK